MIPAVSGDDRVISLGLDVADIARFERERARHGPRIGEAFLRPAEVACCDRASRPARAMALHFAAKEAFFKALGTGRTKAVSWHDLEIVGVGGASPLIRPGAACVPHIVGLGVGRVLLTLSATARQAAAIVLLVGRRE